MRKDKLSKLEMPAAGQEDEMLMMDEEMMMDEEAPEAEAESELTDVADEDLVAELEARGFIVEAPEAEEADADAGMEDELDMEDELA